LKRTFNTTDDSGNALSFNHMAIGDVRVKGIYSGFSEDMSTALTYGLKLPIGNRSFTSFGPDTSIGTDSRDWLLGGYRQCALTIDAKLNLFVNGQWQHAFTAVDNFRRGNE
jgi:hypothetical protein